MGSVYFCVTIGLLGLVTRLLPKSKNSEWETAKDLLYFFGYLFTFIGFLLAMLTGMSMGAACG